MSAVTAAGPVLDDEPEIEEDDLTDDGESPDAGHDDDGIDHYEIVDGVKVETQPMSADAADFANFLAIEINAVTVPAGLGAAHVETLFRLPLPEDRNRKPDVAFVPFSRWPRSRPVPRVNARDVLPDLCVEVISPTDRAEDVRGKTEEYLRAGVRLVWVVYPRIQVVDVYEPGGVIRTLRRADSLDGGAVLPGFALPLATLFPAADAAPPSELRTPHSP